jgi:hypothetical protein
MRVWSMHMNSTLMRRGMGVMLGAWLALAACWAGSALGATIRETYVLAPSGEQATFEPVPGVVRSIVENGAGGQSVKLAFKAYPDRDKQIVEMLVYIARSVQRDVTFEYHHPLAIKARPLKPGSEVWALPQDADRRPVFDLSDQNIAAPTKVYVYVVEKDRDGKSYSTLVETRYAALHAAFVDNR